MTLHTGISYVKSAFRIIGYLLLPFSVVLAVGVLVFSEILGIVEETIL